MPKSAMANPDSSPVPEITLLDRADESPTDLLYRAAVGPISADYYLPLLARFEQAGRAHLSWNWAACLYTLNWMAFRSLWVAALAYVGIMLFVPLLVFGIGRLVLQLSDATETTLLVAWGVLSFVVPGVVGNAVLRSDLRKRMTRAITDSNTLVQACDLLAAQASSRQRLIGLGGVNLILLGGALGFYLAVPQDGLLARVRTGQTLERIAETGPVIDLASQPALAVASVAAPVASSASEPTPFAAAAAASTPLPVEPAPVPIAALPVLAAPASPPLVAPSPPQQQPLPVAVVRPRRTGPAFAEPKVLTPYFINVGLFAKEANARRAQATLQEAGLSPTTQEIGTGQGKRTRLRAGPFDTLAQAEAAAEKIRSLKLEAQVFQP